MNAKPLFILVMFVMLIALFAGGSIGTTDLTPDTPPSEVAGISAFAAAPDVSTGLLYSPCAGMYTVLAGDTLFRIAQACGISVADIVSANPTIQDPNVISPGQQIMIPGPSAPAPAAQIVATAPQTVAAQQEVADAELTPTEAPQEMAVVQEPAASAGEEPAAAVEPAAAPADNGGDYGPEQPAAEEQPAADASTLPEGLVPGGIIHVTVKSLPPTTPVSLGIGRAGDTPVMIEDRITNEKGELVIHIAIPRTAKPGEQWTVSVMTMIKPKTLVQSVPFTIQ